MLRGGGDDRGQAVRGQDDLAARSPALLPFSTSPVLDIELHELAAGNPCIDAVQLPTTHLGPAWDALDDAAAVIEPLLAQRSTCEQLSQTATGRTLRPTPIIPRIDA